MKGLSAVRLSSWERASASNSQPLGNPRGLLAPTPRIKTVGVLIEICFSPWLSQRHDSRVGAREAPSAAHLRDLIHSIDQNMGGKSPKHTLYRSNRALNFF